MDEWEKGQNGYLYNANNDPAIMEKHLNCLNQCFALNQLAPVKKEEREQKLREIIGKIEPDFDILSPFFCLRSEIVIPKENKAKTCGRDKIPAAGFSVSR